ncbi:TetR/AcrR family transcriptional regulator [Paramicrobacterium chengjingii]|uniref:TetR/AcrR family transcriptional regulator n=1 Tax=Paramicrobacterium chengjingii TaxID=2769067 RepID=UPI00141E69DA|nr:TetR/AcrR family transcriptional regulator [Microbacterium chengjingii]
MRSDTERNRHRLIKSAARLVASRGHEVRMTDVAEKAEVSTATAYRHFASVDELLQQFRYDVGLKLLEFSKKQTTTGADLLGAICSEWIRLVVKHGRAMVITRSREGYLARLRSDAPYLTVQADALGPAVSSAAVALEIDDPGDEGLFLWNILFDPREIFDLLETVGLSQSEAADRLFQTYCGALRGWSESKRAHSTSAS